MVDRSGRLGRRRLRSLHTFAEIERQDTVLHEQLRSVWTKLIEAARAAALDESMLLAAGDYLRAHWKYPAATEPVLAGRSGSFTPSKTATAGDKILVAPLLARALWSRILHDSRKHQQARVAASPECHTRAFAELLLAELAAAPSRDEAEFIASLALRAAEGMAEPGRFAEDLLGQVWTEVANARRNAAEWQHARAALRRSEEHLSRGSADPLLKGRLRSVTASLSADQGHYREALAILEECQAIHEEARAWPLVAQTLVHRAFEIAEFRRSGHARAGAGRSTFTAARLLEGLGHVREAEQLFEAVIADGFEREAYREAFLDILYLFGMHVRRGAMDKAVALCRLALARLDLFDIGNEQLRTVWSQLRDAAMRRSIRLESLAEVRQFLKVHWKTPAAKAPRLSLR